MQVADWFSVGTLLNYDCANLEININTRLKFINRLALQYLICKFDHLLYTKDNRSYILIEHCIHFYRRFAMVTLKNVFYCAKGHGMLVLIYF